MVLASEIDRELSFPPLGCLESDEPQMETPEHAAQLEFLLAILRRLWQERKDIYLASNTSIYFNTEQLKKRDFCGPDLFVVKNPKQRKEGERNSWVVWEEDGRYPDFIIELLSERTANKDRTTKKEIYQDIFRTPEYFYFAPKQSRTTAKNELAGFRLVAGTYQPIQPDASGWLWSEVLGLYLGVCKGDFLGEYAELLRFYFPDRTLVLYPTEAEVLARQEKERERQDKERERDRADLAEARADRAEVEKVRAESERIREKERADRLAAKLRELGIDPEEV